VVERTGRYADVNQLAFAIVHALEDRDSGLTAEIDALRRQVAALSTKGGPASSSGVDLTVLEAVVAREPELRQELNGAFQQALDQVRGGHSDSSATLMPLLTLSIAQALRRRDAELGGALSQLREQVTELTQQVATIAQTLGTVRSRVDHRSELTSLRDMLSSELGALRQQVSTIEAKGGETKSSAPASSKAAGKARKRGAARGADTDAATKPMPLSEIRLVFDVLRRGGSELDGKLEFLRQLGYERAIRKSGDPKVDVSPSAALLLGVAELLDEREGR
jgi:polyhydroxyalkanoate synthesis regulator phasin